MGGIVMPSSSTFVIAMIITLIIVIALYVLILPDSKRPMLNSFFKGVHDFLKVKKLLLEEIFRFVYIFAVVACVVLGFIGLFKSFGMGLLIMILGPFACRIIYECMILGLILVRNVIEINNYLHGIQKTPTEKSNISVEKIINGVSKTLKDITTTPVPPAPQPSTAPVDSEQTSSEQASSEQASGSAKFCPSCGKALPDGSEFCIYCGTKL